MTPATTYDAVSTRRAWLLAQGRFAQARRAEGEYGAQLKKVARAVGGIVRGFAPSGSLEDFFNLREALGRYAELLRPWARSVAARMLADISRRDAFAWFEHGKDMGRALKKEIESAPTGEILRKSLEEQVGLITSLPREAAERVHKLALTSITQGERPDALAQEIMRTGEVTKSRAELIARTEVSRAAGELTAARAKWVGATHYEWLTAGDIEVRPLHRKLNGKVFAFDDPPIIGEKGERGLPGSTYNCRCVLLPIIPDQI